MFSLTVFLHERHIRKVLKSLSQQRVTMIWPNNIWVIENVPQLSNKQEALNTCLLRGWVEILENAVPTGELNENTFKHSQSNFSHYSTIYRITDSGWAVINRTHSWILATFSISLLALISSIIQLWKN